jgi:molybdopterin-binding protein
MPNPKGISTDCCICATPLCNWVSVFPRSSSGFIRERFAAFDRLLFRARDKAESQREPRLRRLSGRNQLVGRIEEVRISGLMAEIVISIGGQRITSIITARSAREMQLKPGQTAAALIKSTEVMILRV